MDWSTESIWQTAGERQLIQLRLFQLEHLLRFLQLSSQTQLAILSRGAVPELVLRQLLKWKRCRRWKQRQAVVEGANLLHFLLALQCLNVSRVSIGHRQSCLPKYLTKGSFHFGSVRNGPLQDGGDGVLDGLPGMVVLEDLLAFDPLDSHPGDLLQ